MKLSEQYFINTIMLSHDDEDDYDGIEDFLDIMFPDGMDDDNDWGF